MNAAQLQTAANELLRELNREVSAEHIQPGRLPQAVGMVEDFAKAFAASETAAKEAAEKPERDNWILSINLELSNLRDWANREAKRAEAAEAERDTLQKALKDEMVQSGEDQKELRAERDRAKEELKHVLDDWNDLVKASGSPTNGAAIGYVKNLVAERDRAVRALPRWITVEEKLPEMDGITYLVYRIEHKTGIRYMEDFTAQGQAAWHNRRKNLPSGITHWQPIPAPPVAEAPRPVQEAPLEPEEFFITRGDGVQERCSYYRQKEGKETMNAAEKFITTWLDARNDHRMMRGADATFSLHEVRGLLVTFAVHETAAKEAAEAERDRAVRALNEIVERSTHYPLANRLQDIRTIAETGLSPVPVPAPTKIEKERTR